MTARTERSTDFIALLGTARWPLRAKPGQTIESVVLVLDNGPTQTGKITRAALAAREYRLTVEWLPRYAPELRDSEGAWRDLRAHHLAHRTFNDLDAAIHRAVERDEDETHPPSVGRAAHLGLGVPYEDR